MAGDELPARDELAADPRGSLTGAAQPIAVAIAIAIAARAAARLTTRV